MNRRLFLATTTASVAAIALPGSAFALTADGAQSFVRQVVDEMLALIRSPAGEAAKRAQFIQIMDRYADMRAIAGFALGRYKRLMPEALKGRYVEAFKRSVAATYVTRFSEYSGESINVGNASPTNIGYLVDTDVLRNGQAPLSVKWDVSDRSGRPLITNFEIEGLKMNMTLQSEYTQLINSYGDDLEKFVQYLESRG